MHKILRFFIISAIVLTCRLVFAVCPGAANITNGGTVYLYPITQVNGESKLSNGKYVGPPSTFDTNEDVGAGKTTITAVAYVIQYYNCFDAAGNLIFIDAIDGLRANAAMTFYLDGITAVSTSSGPQGQVTISIPTPSAKVHNLGINQTQNTYTWNVKVGGRTFAPILSVLLQD
jgi:hypothetical protein